MTYLNPIKLNIGCGSNKIAGFINIDTEESCKPDFIHNILEAPLPFKDGEVDEIVFFHCIEHIQKRYHQSVLEEFNRALKPHGKLYISYPNFWECAQRWKQNFAGQKKFWEATLYGRQLYETDYHVCAMDPDELADLLCIVGFTDISSYPELGEPFNSITFARKSLNKSVHYEDVLRKEIGNTVVKCQ
jgi:SAM-dependent methyltransferase